jgi:hypothetical protein
MPYPDRPVLETLPQFRGMNVTRPTAEQRAELLEFIATEYRAGRSLRQLAELTGRAQAAAVALWTRQEYPGVRGAPTAFTPTGDCRTALARPVLTR